MRALQILHKTFGNKSSSNANSFHLGSLQFPKAATATKNSNIYSNLTQKFSSSSHQKQVSTPLFGKLFSNLPQTTGFTGFAAGVSAGLAYFGFNSFQSNNTALASDGLHAPKYPWNHRYPWQAFDHASIRRGYQVYKEVCATCHSLDRISFRNLVDVAYTEDEMKEIAAEFEIEDGPNSDGDMFTRPRKLMDKMPAPYKNEEEGKKANGAYPPDLSLVVKARHGGEDYIFSLLTGYCDPPEGYKLPEGLNYNPYFPGGAISMPNPLAGADIVEYEDGTEASVSQMARDVTTFLSWAAEPKQDERKKMGIKAIIVLLSVSVPVLFWKRKVWSVLKGRHIQFVDRK